MDAPVHDFVWLIMHIEIARVGWLRHNIPAVHGRVCVAVVRPVLDRLSAGIVELAHNPGPSLKRISDPSEERIDDVSIQIIRDDL